MDAHKALTDAIARIRQRVKAEEVKELADAVANLGLDMTVAAIDPFVPKFLAESIGTGIAYAKNAVDARINSAIDSAWTMPAETPATAPAEAPALPQETPTKS